MSPELARCFSKSLGRPQHGQTFGRGSCKLPCAIPSRWDHPRLATGTGRAVSACLISRLFSLPGHLRRAIFIFKNRRQTSGSSHSWRNIFWQSPAIQIVNAHGSVLPPAAVAAGAAEPASLRIVLRNRGRHVAHRPVVTVWWAPLQNLYPLPASAKGYAPWHGSGLTVQGKPANMQVTADFEPGEQRIVEFAWNPPPELSKGANPHVLLAVVSSDDDPSDPDDTLCAQNNAAALTVAASARRRKIPFQIIGSDDTDGVTQ